MTQQINLYDTRLRPQRVVFNALQASALVAAVLLLCAGIGGTLNWFTADTQAQLRSLQAQTAALGPAMATTAASQPASATPEDLAQLRAFEASQRQVRAALEAGGAVAAEGYAGYFQALARQASAQVWLTGFSVSADGEALELQGRMADAAALTDYLRQLNAEPRFKGRPFAQLKISTVEGGSGAAAPYNEFTLRSLPARDEAAR